MSADFPSIPDFTNEVPGASIDQDTALGDSTYHMPTWGLHVNDEIVAIATYLLALGWKKPCRVATTANVDLAGGGLANGTSHDGVTVATGERVLVNSQSTGSQNGIYVVPASGAASRATDAAAGTLLSGATVAVNAGDVNADTVWTLTTNDPITVGSTSLTFTQQPTAASVAELIRDTIGTALAAGTGITVTVDDPANTITVAIDTSAIDERARDALGTALVAGTGITITPDDPANTITVAIDTSAIDERARDALGSALVAGTGITITPDDGANTITISVSGGGSAPPTWKEAVAAATVTNIDLAGGGLANGTNLDGYTAATGDRIAVINQSTPSQNGIYIVPASGAASRATDADTSAEFEDGAKVYVQRGFYAGSFVQFMPATQPFTLGTHSLPADREDYVARALTTSENTWTKSQLVAPEEASVGEYCLKVQHDKDLNPVGLWVNTTSTDGTESTLKATVDGTSIFEVKGALVRAYDVVIPEGGAAFKSVGSASGEVAAGDHSHGNIGQETQQVVALTGGIANTNWDTPTQNNAWMLGGALQSSGAQNAEVSFDVYLGTGTWRLDVLARHSSDAGIAALSLDGTALTGLGGSATSVDFYSAASVNTRTQITGIAIAAAGVKRIRLLLSTKNASSSSYFGRLNMLSFIRTGA